ncbi:MAG: hypothetical protein NVSMB17_03760 [Candidatus Dormibacteria bacterium]
MAERAPLFNRAGVVAGLAAPFFCLLSDGLTILLRGRLSLLQDFYIFWAAARVLDNGGNPYENAALTAVLKPAGVDTLLGTGYSYPLLLAEVLRPIGLLEPHLAGAIFVAVSSLGLGLAVALLVASLRGISWWLAVILGAAAGLGPAVSFGMFEGQSNLLVLPFLALAYREVVPGVGVAVATAVKLYPISGLVALAGNRRWREVAVGVGLTVVLVLGPVLLGGPGGGDSAAKAQKLLAPDVYFTNMSINGLLSRAALFPAYPLRGVPVEAVDAVVVALLGLLTLAVLWRARFQPFPGAFALVLWLSTVSAPKNSLWNFAPLLLPMTFLAGSARRHPRAAVVAAAGLVLMGIQVTFVWAYNNANTFDPVVAYRDLLTVLDSGTALLGALMIGGATMAVMWSDASAPDRAPGGFEQGSIVSEGHRSRVE